MLCNKMQSFATRYKATPVFHRTFCQSIGRQKCMISNHIKTISPLTKFPTLSRYRLNSVQNARFSSSLDLNKTVKKKENDAMYIGPLKTQIKIVKILSLSSTAIGFALQPFVVYNISKISLVMGAATAVLSTIFFLTPVMLHWITKRYVIELYFDNTTKIFTAKTLTLFNKMQEIKFTAADVSVPTLPGILSSLHVRDMPLFVDRRLVTDPDAYEHMVGLDKPFELLIKDEVDEKK